MKTLFVLLLLLNAQPVTAAVVVENHAGWTFAALPNDPLIQGLSGGAKYAFFNGKGDSTINVYVNEISPAPDIDVRARDAWRAKIIGVNPKTLTIISDSTFKIGATIHYLCHYQSSEGGTIPIDVVLRATLVEGKLYLFTWKQNHEMYQAHAGRVIEFLRHVVIN